MIASIKLSWRRPERRLQTELLNTKKWSTTLELTAAMADHIYNFHNAERRHSYLGKHQPDRV
ncbi:transposase InsO family protein [Rhodococcus erythropolis]|nr:transposase InsO family protein [Rhodococcus erythropolis]MCW2425163.1 transposase InsO family protein [Rhodococcus erythropolis]